MLISFSAVGFAQWVSLIKRLFSKLALSPENDVLLIHLAFSILYRYIYREKMTRLTDYVQIICVEFILIWNKVLMYVYIKLHDAASLLSRGKTLL